MNRLQRHLHQSDHAAALGRSHRDHLLEQVVPVVDQVVAEQHGEGVVADVIRGAQDGMAQTQWLALAHVVDVAKVAGLAHARKTLLVPFGLQRTLQLPMPVEVVLERGLVAAGHHEDIAQPGARGLLDDVLDGWLVDDRQHLLRRGLGRGQEAGAHAGCRNHGLGDGAQ